MNNRFKSIITTYTIILIKNIRIISNYNIVTQRKINYIFLSCLEIFSDTISSIIDLLCGLVVRVPGYISRGPGSILGTTRFIERSGTASTHPCKTEELLERKNRGSSLGNREYGRKDALR
jgi:hypothetical protein